MEGGLSSAFDIHAFEIRAMIDVSIITLFFLSISLAYQNLQNHTIVNSMITTIFGLIKHYSEISLKNQKAKNDIWWPYLLDSFIDLSCYGFCAYIRRKNRTSGVVYPEHVNLANCTISYDQNGQIEITPRFGKLVGMPNAQKRIKVFVWQEPRWDTYKLRSPMARLLMSYRRLLRLNSNYLEQEHRISNPVIYLEDTHGSHTSVYEAVSAQNPSWGSSIPGMMLSAKDQLQERQQINEYIRQLQQGMVDMINRTEENPGAQFSNGIALDKRKKINDIQVPLPSNKRANCFLPSNRTQILEFEEFFLKEVPWAFGFPMSFFENQQSKVSANYKLLESISVAALQTQVQILERLLQQVSRDLFYLQELVINSPMRVTIKLKEQSIDYEVGTGNKAPSQPAKSTDSGSTPPEPAKPIVKEETSPKKEEKKKRKVTLTMKKRVAHQKRKKEI